MNTPSSDMRPEVLEPLLRRVLGHLPAYTIEPLFGQASARRYYRLKAEGSSFLIMQLPPDPLKSEEASDDGVASELPFLSVGSLLRARGVRVPEVLAHDVGGGLLLLEDLGDERFEDRLLARPEEREALYGEAVDALAEMHSACADLPEGSLPTTRHFDEALFRRELDEFREFGLEALHGPLTEGERERFEGSVDSLVHSLVAAKTGFVHRDFQSRNLMWRGDELVVIDFQDAMTGPVPYDLVALLCDSYVDVPRSLQDAMIERYLQRTGISGAAADNFRHTFWRLAVQRKLKDAGRFVSIARVRNNPSFLPHVPQSLEYVGRALQVLGSELADLEGLLRAKIPGFPEDVSIPE